eukprot:1161474-Pelagomonas_calceolata.AAC.13
MVTHPIPPSHSATHVQLLGVLPTLPSLTHLALGDVGSTHSVARSLQTPMPGVMAHGDSACTVVQAKELQQLQACPKLTHLELHTLRTACCMHTGQPVPGAQDSLFQDSLLHAHRAACSRCTGQPVLDAQDRQPVPGAQDCMVFWVQKVKLLYCQDEQGSSSIVSKNENCLFV